MRGVNLRLNLHCAISPDGTRLLTRVSFRSYVELALLDALTHFAPKPMQEQLGLLHQPGVAWITLWLYMSSVDHHAPYAMSMSAHDNAKLRAYPHRLSGALRASSPAMPKRIITTSASGGSW